MQMQIQTLVQMLMRVPTLMLNASNPIGRDVGDACACEVDNAMI